MATATRATADGCFPLVEVVTDPGRLWTGTGTVFADCAGNLAAGSVSDDDTPILIGAGGHCRRKEHWRVFVEVTTQQLSQADAARKRGVDVSTVVKLRRPAQDACTGGVPGVQAWSAGVDEEGVSALQDL